MVPPFLRRVVLLLAASIVGTCSILAHLVGSPDLAISSADPKESTPVHRSRQQAVAKFAPADSLRGEHSLAKAARPKPVGKTLVKILVPLLAAAIVGGCTVFAALLSKRRRATQRPSPVKNQTFFPNRQEHRASNAIDFLIRAQGLLTPYWIIWPGARLSFVKSIYPSPPAKFSYIYGEPCYEVPLSAGSFECIQHYFCETKADPEIHRVTLVFRDDACAAMIRQLALHVFGSDSVMSTSSESLIWKNISGLTVAIRQNRACELEKSNTVQEDC